MSDINCPKCGTNRGFWEDEGADSAGVFLVCPCGYYMSNWEADEYRKLAKKNPNISEKEIFKLINKKRKLLGFKSEE